jgi:hypothetical protein
MIAEVREALANLKTDFPTYAGQGYELAGFVWYHGWNDGVDPKHAVPEYEQNLVNLIRDVRKDLKAPALPVVIGELTGPWADAPGEWATLRKAQAAAAARPEFRGTVRFVPTRDFVRPAKVSPNPTHGHHEFGNAETYVLVGDALGKGMVRLLRPQPVKKPEVPPKKVFQVDGHPGFVLMPVRVDEKRPVPWVWYAPTFPNLPEAREHWMFEQFLAAGVAVAGVDVGESYGSPTGRATYSALYKELVTGRNFATKPVLLARSRGGLMLYNWAAENPDAVGGIAGIYPVCDLRSYPGLEKACGAYGLTRAELEGQLDKHNPVARLAPLAKAGVPIFHIHGDGDAVVPLKANSEEVHRQYEKLGGRMELKVVGGQGHNLWEGFFRCQELVDFVLARFVADRDDRRESGQREPERRTSGPLRQSDNGWGHAPAAEHASQTRRVERRWDAGRDKPADGVGREPLPQPPPGPRQPRFDRSLRTLKDRCRGSQRVPLKVAQDERVPQAGREAVDRRVKVAGEFGRLGPGDRAGPRVDRLGRERPAPPQVEPGPDGDAVQPGRDGRGSADRGGLAGQDQEGGLKRVLGRVVVREDPAAGRPDHRPVPVGEEFERGLVAVGDEPGDQVGVGHAGQVPDVQGPDGGHGESSAGVYRGDGTTGPNPPRFTQADDSALANNPLSPAHARRSAERSGGSP